MSGFSDTESERDWTNVEAEQVYQTAMTQEASPASPQEASPAAATPPSIRTDVAAIEPTATSPSPSAKKRGKQTAVTHMVQSRSSPSLHHSMAMAQRQLAQEKHEDDSNLRELIKMLLEQNSQLMKRLAVNEAQLLRQDRMLQALCKGLARHARMPDLMKATKGAIPVWEGREPVPGPKDEHMREMSDEEQLILRHQMEQLREHHLHKQNTICRQILWPQTWFEDKQDVSLRVVLDGLNTRQLWKLYALCEERDRPPTEHDIFTDEELAQLAKKPRKGKDKELSQDAAGRDACDLLEAKLVAEGSQRQYQRNMAQAQELLEQAPTSTGEASNARASPSLLLSSAP